ncbi:MAG TPA: SRPBCC family protein, partial [Chthonomonas sp.]|uniref:SRPBCC family protein n=1 Tax=Chthonomonas sp. TaxID=2282153 RepID=UPI002B4AEDFB
MPQLRFVCEINAPLERVWEFHNKVDSLLLLTPPQLRPRILDPRPPMQEGSLYLIRISLFGFLPITMKTRIVEYNPPHSFTDRQEAGPFRRWQHAHRLEALNPNQTRLCDTVEYELPLGGVGAMGERIWVRRRVEELFAYRHRRTKEVLE